MYFVVVMEINVNVYIPTTTENTIYLKYNAIVCDAKCTWREMNPNNIGSRNLTWMSFDEGRGGNRLISCHKTNTEIKTKNIKEIIFRYYNISKI